MARQGREMPSGTRTSVRVPLVCRTPFGYLDVVELSTPGLIVSPLEVTG